MKRPLALAFAGMTACAFVSYAFASGCPSGTTLITSGTRAAATASGIPTSAQCWIPSDPNAGQGVGDTKMWLQQHATANSNIACMNADFAEKLKKFMQAAGQANGGTIPTITDGYRDPGKQTALVASGASQAGPCQSYHNYGLAADFNNNSKQMTTWMRSNAAQFGIGHIGDWDPNHFQEGVSGRYGQCGGCANSGGDGKQAPYSSAGGSPSGSSSGSPSGSSSKSPDDVSYKPKSGTTSCYPGYNYSNGQCTIAPVNQSQNQVQNPTTECTGLYCKSPLTSNCSSSTFSGAVASSTASDTSQTTTQCSAAQDTSCDANSVYYNGACFPLSAQQVMSSLESVVGDLSSISSSTDTTTAGNGNSVNLFTSPTQTTSYGTVDANGTQSWSLVTNNAANTVNDTQDISSAVPSIVHTIAINTDSAAQITSLSPDSHTPTQASVNTPSQNAEIAVHTDSATDQIAPPAAQIREGAGTFFTSDLDVIPSAPTNPLFDNPFTQGIRQLFIYLGRIF